MKSFLASLVLLLFFGSVAAQSGYALQFNGSNYVNGSNDASLSITGTGICLEAWINPSSFASNSWEGSIIDKEDILSNGYVLRCGGSGQLSFVVGNGSSWYEVISPVNSLALNQWQHVAGVYTGTQLLIYINGVLAGSTNASISISAANSIPLQIGYSGAAWTPARSYYGQIDEVRIWNTSRTQAEIRTNLFNRNLSNSASGLVAYYRMEEGSGSLAANSCTNTGSALDGTLVNSPVWTVSPVQFSSNALSFDGVDDYVDIPHTSSQDISTALTLEAWVYPAKNSGTQDVICKSSLGTNTGYIFPRTDDGWLNTSFWLFAGGAWRTMQAPFPALNSWHHLAATYDGATMKIYVDGALAASQPQTGSIAVNSNPLTLGDQPGFSEYFGGSADELRVWNFARTQAQIQADMNRELDPATAGGLVAYFNADEGIQAGANTGLITLPNQAGNENGTLQNFALSGTSSNWVAQYSSLIGLPLNWVMFAANSWQNEIRLNWQTTQERNLSDFSVEHSTDGRNWSSIGLKIPAHNTGGGIQSYQFIDEQPASGLNLYRIRAIDLDGRYQLSSIRQLWLRSASTGPHLFPNPVRNGSVFIQLNQTGMVRLYNLQGQCVKTWFLAKGMQQVDLSGISQGLYQLEYDHQSAPLLIR